MEKKGVARVMEVGRVGRVVFVFGGIRDSFLIK